MTRGSELIPHEASYSFLQIPLNTDRVDFYDINRYSYVDRWHGRMMPGVRAHYDLRGLEVTFWANTLSQMDRANRRGFHLVVSLVDRSELFQASLKDKC